MVNCSYSHSETFSSVSILSIICIQFIFIILVQINILFQAVFAKNQNVCASISHPKATDRRKVLNAIIRYHGPVVNIRNMVKNLHNITTHMVKGNQNKWCV